MCWHENDVNRLDGTSVKYVKCGLLTIRIVGTTDKFHFQSIETD